MWMKREELNKVMEENFGVDKGEDHCGNHQFHHQR